MGKIKPAYSDDRVTLYCADALKVLPHLTFNHCISDAPYETTIHRAKGKKHRKGLRTDGGPDLKKLGFESVDEFRDKFVPLLKGRCSGWFLEFCTPEGIAPWRDAIEAAGLRYKRACFWVKPDAAPQFNGQGPSFAVEPFVAAWCGRGVSRWNGGGRRNWWECNTNNPDREGTHETEKPIELMMRLIEDFTNPDDLICDPCMGSGTTIIAALAAGRRAIGIERDVATFKLARARLVSAFTMGRAEGRRYIDCKLGRIGRAEDLPLFGAADAG